jgi:hypothetical protein
MNITELLYQELMVVSRARVAKLYNEPTFSITEQLAMMRVDSERREADLDQWPHSNIIISKHSVKKDVSWESSRESALRMYKFAAILEQYNLLRIEVDHACQLIFDEWERRKQASSQKVKRFFKFYVPLSKSVHKNLKRDAARYSLLMLMSELEHEATCGTIYRSDAGYSPKVKDTKNELGRKTSTRSRVEAYITDQKDRSLYPAYEIVDGVVTSNYALLMGE